MPHYRAESLGGSPAGRSWCAKTTRLAAGEVTWERLSTYPLIRLYVSGQGAARGSEKGRLPSCLLGDHNLGINA